MTIADDAHLAEVEMQAVIAAADAWTDTEEPLAKAPPARPPALRRAFRIPPTPRNRSRSLRRLRVGGLASLPSPATEVESPPRATGSGIPRDSQGNPLE